MLINLYGQFKIRGFKVNIYTFRYNQKEEFFKKAFDPNDICELKGNLISKYSQLRYKIRQSNSYNIVHSGHVDFYLATLFLNSPYSIFKHHPSAMTINCTDKFAYFNKNCLRIILKDNPGSKMILDKKNSLKIKDKFYLNIRAIVSHLAMNKSKNNFVLSDYSKKEKSFLYNVDATVVQGALDDSIKYYNPDLKKSKNKKGKVFLSVARLENYKRIDIVILAFKEFLKNDLNAKLLICGSGPQLEFLKNMVQELDIETNVEFLGFVSDKDLIKYYNIADVFISIDWADYRITQFEALACATPVIVSNETDYALKKYFEGTNYYFTSKPNTKKLIKTVYSLLKKNRNKEKLFKKLKKFYWSEYANTIHNHVRKL